MPGERKTQSFDGSWPRFFACIAGSAPTVGRIASESINDLLWKNAASRYLSPGGSGKSDPRGAPP
jgi:hypothetical protein